MSEIVLPGPGEKKTVSYEDSIYESLLMKERADKIKILGIALQISKIQTEDINSPFEFQPLNNASEAIEKMQMSLGEAFSRRMDFISEEERLDLSQTLANTLKTSGKMYVIYSEGKIQSLAILKPLEFENEQKNLVSWIWKSPHGVLSRNDLLSATKKLIGKQTQVQSVAYVLHENKRSLKFFEDLGFERKWISIKGF